MSRINSILLPPFSALYGAITKSRVNLYRRGTFRSSKLPVPVISVGNLTVGGTGKTPLVEWVAGHLAEEGKKVCILTRGYKRRNPKEHVLVSDGETVLANAFDAGDEAFQLANRLIGKAAVISNANRFSAGEGAIKHLGANCFVLDDGFQHLQLARDLDIVTIDATDPWGGGRLLPYGRLRESKSQLARADCVVLTRADQASDISAVRSEVAGLMRDGPVFTSVMKPHGLHPVDSRANSSGPGRRCFAFCGIGNPNSFFTQLSELNFEIVGRKAYVDHYAYHHSDVMDLVQNARLAGAESLITTEKDAVKLRMLSFDLPCYFLRIKIQIENDSALKQVIRDRITQHLHQMSESGKGATW